MRIAIAQINPTVGNLQGNQNKIIDFVNEAKEKAADLVVFPELAICGYPPEDLLHKDHFVQNNHKALKKVVKAVKGMSAIVGFVDSDKDKNLFNAAALITDGKIEHVYHKIALPNYSVFDEMRYFRSGSKSDVFKVKGEKIGINICEDVWVDKGAYFYQAKKGAKVLINISSSPYEMEKIEDREKLISRRAKEVKKSIVYCNCVGGQDELVFDGGSFVVDADGNLLARAKQFSEELLVVDTEDRTVNTIEPRSDLTAEIYEALVLGTRDYIRKNHFDKVVIGLSGGIDSALVTAIAVDAIGAGNVNVVSMPSKFTSKGTRSDAKLLAKNFDVKLLEIPIGRTFKSYLTALQEPFAFEAPNVAEENLQARIRGNLLMALSNKFGWLVLTTGNKSEMAVGYCTLYGDMSGGFAVIKDVLKTKVYELARYRNKVAGSELIPKSILIRPPSAELREDQKDQDSLPPYEVLDEILVNYVEKHQSIKQIVGGGIDEDVVQDVIGLVDRSEYKRRQAPPGVKISDRAFGKDWRLPITNRYREF